MLILGLQNASRTPRGRDQVIVSRGQQTILRLEQFFRDTREEKIGPIFSYCGPFPSWPSVANDTYLQYHKTSRVILTL